ncbi:hypothetical protein Tco_0780557 [Tanacetum coccineum]
MRAKHGAIPRFPFHHGSKSKDFSKLKGMEDNSSGPYHDGRVKLVISRAPIGSLKQGCHVAMKKAQGS